MLLCELGLSAAYPLGQFQSEDQNESPQRGVGWHDRVMPITVEFFVAPDDEVAARVGPRQRGHGFPALACSDFFPDDAVAD